MGSKQSTKVSWENYKSNYSKRDSKENYRAN